METKTISEVRLLRSAVISMIGKDSEGDYRPAFVKKILRAAKEVPTSTFKDEASFLAELNRV